MTSVSALHFLLVIAVIPIGLALLITLLVYAPSLARGQRQESGTAWRDQNVWFGGPRDGVEAAEKVDQSVLEASTSRSGGASARW